MAGTDRFTEPDADPAWSDPTVVVYAVTDDRAELTDALGDDAIRFDHLHEAEAFVRTMTDMGIVRITIETEW